VSLLAVINFFRHQIPTLGWQSTDRNHTASSAEAQITNVINRSLLVAPGESIDMPAGKRLLINSLDHKIYSQYHYLSASLHDKGTIYAGLGKAALARMQYEKAVRLKNLLYE
jgi:hypothetical protein